MSDHILVSVAWPYANAEIHVGNLTGAYLPADIYARYHRLVGNKVLMVSGSDAHGTPITIRADTEKKTPLEVYQHFHHSFLNLFIKLGISYDLFTSTHTSNHFNVSQKVFLALHQNGNLYKNKEMQWYAPSQQRFLPDRYVEGTCYLCGYASARSDQCDLCGNLLEPEKLINPRSRIDGTTPELRETEHYYLDLAKLQNVVVEFLEKRKEHLRPNVVRQSLGQIYAEGLHGRPITRDLDWGIPVPLEGLVGKCLYVWFEAVIGYLSASIEWSQINPKMESWRAWWDEPTARGYYFIGKDNIPFHAIIWPAQLAGCGKAFEELMGVPSPKPLVLPYDVPANEFMNLEGQKISGSRNWAVWGHDVLTRYDPDPIRYYLTVNMPEAKDTDWSWEDFYKRNNDELVATWGNLVNRVLAFACKNWDNKVPEPGELQSEDQELLASMEKGFQTVGDELNAVHLRAALAEAMRLATEVNRYLDQAAPWATVKQDKGSAGRAIFVAIQAINSLKILLAPFLPFTSERLHLFLGYDKPLFGQQHIEEQTDGLGTHAVLKYNGYGADGRWRAEAIEPGRLLSPPEPLFRKLDAKIIEEERARLGS